MRTILTLVFSVALTAVALPSAHAAAAYYLECNGGGTMTFGYVAQENKLYATFTRTPRGVDGQKLAPGECAWPDRGVKESEPNTICVFGADVFVSWTANQPNGQQVIKGGGANTRESSMLIFDAGHPGPYPTQGEFLIFHVANDGHGCLRVQ